MKKKVLAITLISTMLLMLVSCGISQDELEKQIDGDTKKTNVNGLEVSYPAEWQVSTNEEGETHIVYQPEDKWVAKEGIKYMKESDEAEDYFADQADDAIDTGSINVKGISGNYIVLKGKATDEDIDEELSEYLATLKIDRSVFTYSYCTSSELFDITQAEKLLGLFDIASYKSPEVSDYSIDYYAPSHGMDVSELQEKAPLYRIYSNGYKESVEDGAWKIIKPKKLSAPKTTITISVDGKELEIDISDIEYKHYSECPDLTDFGNFSGIKPSEVKKKSGYTMSYNPDDKYNSYAEYYDRYYKYPITSENRHYINEYYELIEKEDGIKDGTSEFSKKIKHFYKYLSPEDEEEFEWESQYLMVDDGDTFTIYSVIEESPFD